MNKAELLGQKFLDNHGYEHTVTKILGEGGQGFVCLTETSGYVLKFVSDENGNLFSEKEHLNTFKYYSAVFKNINHLPIENKDHLAIPVAILTNYAGYVMRLMEDMNVFSILDDGPKSYPETGGHRYRLEILSKCASILSNIHSKGMVYCDISPNNIFITKDNKSKNQNVWFIDTDNLFIPSTNHKPKLVYTPRYAAPELITSKAEGCSQNSDLYSFAIMAYECLSMIHPFAGKAAIEGIGSNDDWDNSSGWDKSSSGDNETSDIDPIYSGKYSWINDPEDDSNRSEDGFLKELFLTQELFDLFQQTFSVGRETAELRPTSYYWQKVLAKASDSTLECPKCKMSHIHEIGLKICPYCENEISDIISIKKNDSLIFSRELVWNENSNVSREFAIPERVFIPFDSKFNSLPLLFISANKVDNSFAITIKKSENPYFTDNVSLSISKDDESQTIAGATTVIINKGDSIKFVVKMKNLSENSFNFTLEM